MTAPFPTKIMGHKAPVLEEKQRKAGEGVHWVEGRRIYQRLSEWSEDGYATVFAVDTAADRNHIDEMSRAAWERI